MSVEIGCNRGRTLNFYSQNHQESLKLEIVKNQIVSEISKFIWIFQNCSPFSRPQIYPGRVPSYLYFGLLSLELLLKFKNNFLLGYCPSSQVVSVLFAGAHYRGCVVRRHRFGVTVYFLPEDETIGEFGYLLRLF